ncbi:MAG: 5'-methylthioadenosine/S-adenosylhomocysteine nucleosidase [Oscillospiraceae bacterium]|nr:5'-methylthioadenosine/S-adenosylhomocysteine nucleosidase [Oscillospiraceae bacterium]
MKRIGMLVAVEMGAVLSRYGKAMAEETRCGFRVFTYDMGEYLLYVIGSGAGEIAAAAACQLLIDRYEAELVVNFGVVGGLTAEMARTKTCVVEKVVHYDFDTSAYDGTVPGQYCEYPDVYLPATAELVRRAREIAPELKPVICASADKFVDGKEAKSALHERFGADICEMEAAAVVLTCNRSGVPCLLIKTVSDGLAGGAEEFGVALRHTSELCLAVADKIIREL